MSTDPILPGPPEPPEVHSTAPGGHAPDERSVTTGHHQLHGRPSSWILVTVVTAAFVAGGFAIIYHAWWLFWVCVGIAVLSVPVGKFIGIMDDTIIGYDTPAQPRQEGHVAEDTGSAADPGVDVGAARQGAAGPGAAGQGRAPADLDKTR